MTDSLVSPASLRLGLTDRVTGWQSGSWRREREKIRRRPVTVLLCEGLDRRPMPSHRRDSLRMRSDTWRAV